MNFFFKNYSYIDTEKIRWNVEDGYSFLTDNDMLVNVTPARTGGTSYYHRLRLMLHTVDEKFLSCPNLKKESSFVVRNEYIFLLTITVVDYNIIKILNEVIPRNQEIQMFLRRKW